jgi:hypothetical protein
MKYYDMHKNAMMNAMNANDIFQAYEPPAICIPRGLGQITHQQLTEVIKKTQLGEIHKIIMKPKEFILPEHERTSNHQDNIVYYNNIYIYFKKWNTDNPTVRKYRENLIKGQTIKIVYKKIPSLIFWRCVAANFHNNNNRTESREIALETK